MITRRHLLIVVALLPIASRAMGSELSLPAEATRDRIGSQVAPPSSMPARLVESELRSEHEWYAPISPVEVFSDPLDADWPAARLRSVDNWLPPKRSSVRGRPQRSPGIGVALADHQVSANAMDWDADAVTAARWASERTADGTPSRNTILQIAATQLEDLPPPTPGEFQWIIESEEEGELLEPPRPDGDPTLTDELLPIPEEQTVLQFQPRQRTTLAARLGYWSVDYSGSPVKVGEYQSLDSSMFFDFDGLHTDGFSTWDYYASLLDNDAPQAGLRFYRPQFRAAARYQGYLRRLDRDPFSPLVDFDQQPTRPLPGPPGNYRGMKEDQTVGDDFAIRIQELDTRFAGRLTDHVNWRLNLWGMRKHGERQSAAFAHCFTAPNATDINGNPVGGNACHILIQNQRIDWLTAEIEPAIQACYGPVTVEYSRTMRTLSTDDQLVTRPYDRLGFTGELPYAVVPENYTEIDRLKIGVSLPDNRHGYARLYTGQTHNRYRDVDRDFRGFDLRLTDRSIPGLNLTGYAKNYVQEGQLPPFLVPFEDAANLRAPINYDRTLAGFDIGWRPFFDELSIRSRLRLGSGYEYRELRRGNAIFEERAVTADNSFTTTNRIHFRTSMNWTPLWETYARYSISFIDNPLYAAPIGNTTVNTLLPTQLHSLRFGNTWSPYQNFHLHGLLGINNGWNNTSIANFSEDNYDLVFTAWYAPTPRWSLSGGLGFYSTWVDQDITLGSKANPATLPWEYGGTSDVINFGTTFAWTQRLTVSGTLDFVRGRNAFDPLSPWPDLWSYSDVNVETTRFGCGLDYDLTPQSALYFRYQLFDYDDKSDLLDGGTADMFLFGGSAYF